MKGIRCYRAGGEDLGFNLREILVGMVIVIGQKRGFWGVFCFDYRYLYMRSIVAPSCERTSSIFFLTFLLTLV